MAEFHLPKKAAEEGFKKTKQAIYNIETYIAEINNELAKDGLPPFHRAELTYKKENELEPMLENQKKILADRQNYFTAIFLPKYEDSVKAFFENEQEYLKTEENAKSIAEKFPSSPLAQIIRGYDPNQTDMELKIQYYKTLKKQVDSFLKQMPNFKYRK
jgi:hypothetical protein